MNCFLGIDLGTSSVKTIVLREDGIPLGITSSDYPISIPSVGYAEQDPSSWWAATVDAVRRALADADARPADIAAIGFSGQMHGLVPLDDRGSIVRPAIIWCDQRSADQVDAAYRVLDRQAMGRVTLNALHPGFLLASLLWMKQCEAGNFERIAKVLLPKDYLRFRMSGSIGTDVTDASSTLAFDTPERRWSPWIIDGLGLPMSLFPECSAPSDVVGGLTASAAAELGLREGIPIVAGGSDQPMQAVGNGVTTPGILSLTTGSGGQLFSVTDNPLFNPALNTHTFCNVVPGTWYVMAATLSAGLSLSWFQDKIAKERDIDLMAADANAVPPGSDGAFFLPYLAGERTPHSDPAARAMFYGLTLKHTRAHMTRAIMEGVAYSYRDCLDVLGGLGIRTDRILASGGGARNRQWLQIQSDVLGREIRMTNATEQAATGAALVAGVGIGAFADIPSTCERMIRVEGSVVRPDPSRMRLYDKGYRIFRDLFACSRGFGPRVTDIE
jgi:xylulokinase